MVAQLKTAEARFVAATPAPEPPPRPRPRPRRTVALVAGLVAPAALLVYNMVRAAPLTIDDSYISFRYARNLAHGLGLVYNVGEHVEGYTNFLWTVLLAGAIRLGVDPALAAKLLGAAAALGTLAIVWRLSERLLPARRVPPLAPWLLASSMVFSGYAVLGLETALFIFLVVAGLLLLAREAEAPSRQPWSGLVYALAGLTRPEAPMYFGLALLLLEPRPRSRRSLVRVALFVAIVGAHLLWRHHYYGAWLPNTFHAKTGALAHQIDWGRGYVAAWLGKTGAVFWFALFGASLAVARRHRLALAVAATAAAVCAYVVAVGGDWMPVFRFLAPFEVFAFLLVDVGLRATAASARRPALVALALFVAGAGWQRVHVMADQARELDATRRGWNGSAGALADWFLKYGHPGTIALGDIGYVGWATNYPILDLLGLVDPVIARLPGGYTAKQGPRYLDYFFSRMPTYALVISSHGDCVHPSVPSIAAVVQDPRDRFRANYELLHRIDVGGEFRWCIYQHRPRIPEVGAHVVFDFEHGYAGWSRTGHAFDAGPTTMTPPNQQPLAGGVGRFVANSFHPTLGDRATGTLTSPPFVLDRGRLRLRVGGGARPATRVELLVDGRVVAHASGIDTEDLLRVDWDVRSLRGRPAQLRLVDEDGAGWGHLLVDDVTLYDVR